MAETLTFVAADGSETPLSALPGVRALGSQGLYMPPFEVAADAVPMQDGSRVRSVRAAVREVTIPVFIDATPETLRTVLRSLARALTPVKGDCRLRSTGDDGLSRELFVRYAGGLELTQARGQSAPHWQKAALVFRAFDPYWYDATPVTQTFTTGTPPTFFPFFPLDLATETVLGAITVDNDGDVDAYPLWTVRGPVSSVVLENTTTGQRLELQTALTAGQSVTIDTRPGAKTVTREDGSNLSLTSDSALWPLAPGLNAVTVTLPDATADSFASITYALRYLTP